MYFDTCEDILRESIAGDVIPSAAFAIGQGREVLRSGVMGDRTRFPEPEKADRDTLYDLASLSKLVSTTMVALRLWSRGDCSCPTRCRAGLRRRNWRGHRKGAPT